MIRLQLEGRFGLFFFPPSFHISGLFHVEVLNI